MRLTDAHLHLQDPLLASSIDAILKSLETIGLSGAVVNGTHEGDWSAVSQIAARRSWLRPSFGVHPWWVGSRSEKWETQLIEALHLHPDAVVGEIGFDGWILSARGRRSSRLSHLIIASREVQREVLARQLALAARLDRPATVHGVHAWPDLGEVLATTTLPRRGVLLHAFSGPQREVSRLLDLGAYFSFNGHFLHDSCRDRQELFARLPGDRLLVETDAPYAPLPESMVMSTLPRLPQGARLNHPANLLVMFQQLSHLRNTRTEDLAWQVERNFLQLFGTRSVNG